MADAAAPKALSGATLAIVAVGLGLANFTVVLDQTVATIMTSEVQTCTPQDFIEDLARTMTDRRIRHVPVVVDGQLRAIVSIGDIVKWRIDELLTERDHLVGYIQQ